jgi:hypothetical protein
MLEIPPLPRLRRGGQNHTSKVRGERLPYNGDVAIGSIAATSQRLNRSTAQRFNLSFFFSFQTLVLPPPCPTPHLGPCAYHGNIK